jgi:hypothetical protein
MIKPITCLTLLFAAGSGLYLYTAKHKVELLDREIARLERTAQDSRARAGLLHAQYDLLGDPDRLRELATQVLTLQPTAPGQFTTMAELDRRLPPPGPLPAVVALPAAPAPAAPALAAPAPEAAPVEERPAEKVIDKIAEKPAAPPAPRPAPRAPSSIPGPSPAPAPVMASATPQRPIAPAPRPTPAPRRAPEPQPAPLVAADSMPRPIHAPPVETAVPMVASALGMARAMLVQPLPATSPQLRR